MSPVYSHSFDPLLVMMYYYKIYHSILAAGPEVSYNSSNSKSNWSTPTKRKIIIN